MRIRAWKEGLISGVSDLCNPYPMPDKGYCGQWLEAKIPGGVLSPEQKKFMTAMEALGYRCDVGIGWQGLLRAWADYLDLDIKVG